MFSPIIASKNIQNGFADYITTSFHFADESYERDLKSAISKEGTIAKGPYLDIGGSYQTGKTLDELIDDGQASPLFRDLENKPEAEKELKLKRPLYLHQEQAVRKINAGKSLIVTTGTGSGKTECFLIPIINHLLREKEAGTLEDAVYAIIIYPMNALANDQIKRMRVLLEDASDIRFGLYNGNTKHTRKEAFTDYQRTHNGKSPLSNEAISREEMQENPPHILITNYSMMEYMLLRPKDDKVFQNAQLKFIVLDEAHIYRGATGMETSLLLRRMHARIAYNRQLQYILTSATLGDSSCDAQILEFGSRLCGIPFEQDCIIRSAMKRFDIQESKALPNDLFIALSDKNEAVSDVLKRYNLPYSPDAKDEEKLFDVCLNSRLYDALRNTAVKPMTLPNLLSGMQKYMPELDMNTLEAFIEVCGRAEKDGANLIRPRYHFFIRTIEGAYITIGQSKHLYLNRLHSATTECGTQTVFEAAVCTDCGRVALVGKLNSKENILTQQAYKGREDDADYYLLKLPEDQIWFSDEDEENAEHNYIVCSVCGALRSDNGSKRYPCDHGADKYVRVRKVKRNDSNRYPCPACGTGHLRRFYLGSETATAVLATDLYEQLPDQEVEPVRPQASAPAPKKSLFARQNVPKPVTHEKIRQFLCFSDSRSEAAFFASSMTRSYEDFLRRRGIWHVIEKLRSEGKESISMDEFVKRLTTYFENTRSFAEWDKEYVSVAGESQKNAWQAMLNELYNARSKTGLISMGAFSVRYHPNNEWAAGVGEEYEISENDARVLLEQLVMDGVFTGALDAGKAYELSDAQRESIFYTSVPQKLVLTKTAEEKGKKKKNNEHGWAARQRPNGNYYPNTRVSRLKKAFGLSDTDCYEFLDGYWQGVLKVNDTDTFAFDACDFNVLIDGAKELSFYRCRKCGRVTSLNFKNTCPNINCTGTLEPFDAKKAAENNHYARLYRSEQMKPLYIKEHTAQLSKTQQSKYQEAFVEKKINALSCSTTFEMGVDVGSLETVYMRNMPPSPSNYVQRAGRAGRGKNASAFVLTYSKLSSHDFTYFAQPENMIQGAISAPIFNLKNEKITRRHIFAIALSYFFMRDPEAFGNDDRSAFLLEGGYARFKDMLQPHVPEKLEALLKQSIPADMHESMGILDGSWVDNMIGPEETDGDKKVGVLESVYLNFQREINDLQKLVNKYHREHDADSEARVSRQLRYMRAGKNDHVPPKRLIDFLVRNNILPKYGFPVDTVELLPFGTQMQKDDDQLQLSRDLQIAIAEYAPGSEIIADGKMYTSRYIRKSFGKDTQNGWEIGAYSECPYCGQRNFTKEYIARGEQRECVSCHKPIPSTRWPKTLEPRLGFQAEDNGKEVPAHRPERGHKTDDYYIGDPHRKIIERREFSINGKKMVLESTANDSLVVISRESYLVCPVCGYAEELHKFPDKHQNSHGFFCTCEREKITTEYSLSHEFKTDVAKITFEDMQAADIDTMYSVMYALLEGLSRKMGIERNDIKGCLHRSETDEGMIYSLVLYDAVAGGAGNVRRIVTDDGRAFEEVLEQALTLLENCTCDSSCYNCIRNYYNQKIHDQLDRKKAIEFLKLWQETPEVIEIEIPESPSEKETEDTADTDSEVEIECGEDISDDYDDWQSMEELLQINPEILKQWDKTGIPFHHMKVAATLKCSGCELDTIILWEQQKIALCDAEKLSSTAPFEAHGWRFPDINTPPQDILRQLQTDKDA